MTRPRIKFTVNDYMTAPPGKRYQLLDGEMILLEGETKTDMSFYVYILRCSDGSYYVGHTDHLESRIVAHQRGEITGYTRDRRPLTLVFSEEFPSRQEAFERERQIKGWSWRKKEALIRQDWDCLRQLARARGSTSSP